MNEQEAAPGWFLRAVAQRPQLRTVDAGGTRISYRVWGDPALPGLVLLHGGAAHSGWWDHIGPQLTSHRVVAPDLTGHGDSDWRSSYDLITWAHEVLAVIEAEGLDKPVVVGHSMGGWVSATIGGMYGDQITAIAILDSPLNDQPPEEERLQERRQPTKVYASVEDAVARFKTIPPQDVVLPFVKEHIGPQSLRPVEGGWTWKFDPQLFGRRILLRELLAKLGCPGALFRSEHGLVTPQMAGEMAQIAREQFAVVDVPAAGHHPMLDQPLALVTGLRTLFTFWPADSRPPAGR
jgi:pimeloyl-ACP methyl ester carboxylesterase